MSALDPGGSDAGAAGFDAARLERISEHVTTRYIETGKLAGAQMIVARHGHVGYFRSLRAARSSSATRAVPDDAIWRIYSMTKPITGVALDVALRTRACSSLSDPVARFIPSWANLKVREVAADGTKTLVEPRRPMNMRDAMMHMTGLGWGGRRTPFATATSPLSEAADTTLASALANPLDGDWTLETLVERLAERPLRFHPGTQWFYSVSTDVCARLVEIISGQRFDEYLDERDLRAAPHGGYRVHAFPTRRSTGSPRTTDGRATSRCASSKTRSRAATASRARSCPVAAASCRRQRTTCASPR